MNDSDKGAQQAFTLPQHPLGPGETQPAGIEPTSFITRTITAFVFAVVCLAALILGNRALALPLLCVAFSAIGTWEFYRIVAPHMNRIPRIVGLIFALSLPIITVVARLRIPANPILHTGGLAALIALLYSVLITFLILLTWVAVTPTSHAKDAAVAFFGALYLGLPLSCLILIREMNRGMDNTGMVLAVATWVSIWAADTFAYLGGSLLGRHKLAPVISPKKSWEGLACGTLGAIGIWFAVPLIITGNAHWPLAIALGFIVSFASLAGDLFESRIKRDAGVKDSGKLLPGHGGILDRIDSLLFTATALFLIFSTLGIALGLVK